MMRVLLHLRWLLILRSTLSGWVVSTRVLKTAVPLALRLIAWRGGIWVSALRISGRSALQIIIIVRWWWTHIVLMILRKSLTVLLLRWQHHRLLLMKYLIVDHLLLLLSIRGWHLTLGIVFILRIFFVTLTCVFVDHKADPKTYWGRSLKVLRSAAKNRRGLLGINLLIDRILGSWRASLKRLMMRRQRLLAISILILEKASDIIIRRIVWKFRFIIFIIIVFSSSRWHLRTLTTGASTYKLLLGHIRVVFLNWLLISSLLRGISYWLL